MLNAKKMVNPSFTRGEYWLLETVVEVAVPICWLNWAEMEEAFNKTGHGMSRALLIETMHKLFTEGLIIAHRFGNWDRTFELSIDQIEAALNEKQNKKEHFYQLTNNGGNHWEAFARPNWNLYVNAGYELPDDDDNWAGEIICANKRHLEGYFSSLSCYHYDVDEDTIHWDVLKPWNATYWKKIPMGNRVRFRCREKAKDLNLPVQQLNQHGYDNLWYQWR